MAALAALAADDAPRTSMISAPRLPTRGMNSFSYQSMSTWSTARSPFTFALNRSGNIVGEWLPQTARSCTSSTPTPSLSASWATARFWSSLVMAVKRSRGTSGALLSAISALVLAGLPTTSTRTSSAAPAFRASPCGLKICPLASSRSARSIPFVRGRAPTSIATFTPSNALTGVVEDLGRGEQREGAVLQLQGGPLRRPHGVRDLEQPQVHLARPARAAGRWRSGTAARSRSGRRRRLR